MSSERAARLRLKYSSHSEKQEAMPLSLYAGSLFTMAASTQAILASIIKLQHYVDILTA